jgi:hypothetical protein
MQVYEDSPQSECRPAYDSKVDEDPKEEQVQWNVENIVGREIEALAWSSRPDDTLAILQAIRKYFLDHMCAAHMMLCPAVTVVAVCIVFGSRLASMGSGGRT